MAFKDDKLRQLIVEQAAEWLVAQSESPLDPCQAQEFMHWLRASPRHVAEYLSIAELDRDLCAVARTDDVVLADLLAETDAAVQRLPMYTADRAAAVSSAQRRSARTSRRRRWLAAAAVLIAMLVGFAAIGWRLLAAAPFTETIATQRGKALSLQLPDGTNLKLDAESEVQVQFSRWRRRIVLARGQAYFAVRRDHGRPFSVVVGHILIRDIGTVFNVNRQGNHDTITVASGQIAVRSLGEARPDRPSWIEEVGSRLQRRQAPVTKLGPNQQLQISDSGRVLSVESADLWASLAWTRGRITFDSTPIARVAREFNRHNATQIEVADQSIGALKISGTFDAGDERAFVAFLRTLPGVVVVADGRNVQVRVTSHVQGRRSY